VIDILSTRRQATLAEFSASNVLLAFDYDGTLAPIVGNPARARMRQATRRVLSRLARCYPTVVISGRAHRDLVHRLARLPLWHVIGDHGLEPWAQTAASAEQVRDWVRHLRSRVAVHHGVVLEDKKYSVTIHYRHARNKPRVRPLLARMARALPNARAIQGEQAINIILRDGPDKGIALQRARRILACDTAIYVGDDGTDEDAFTSAPRDQLLAIRVGRAVRSRARFYIKAQSDIDRLLQVLLALRGDRRSTVPG
jgi:trehalose 6-phosphate phosphatase